MEQVLRFNYNGKEYSGYLISSFNIIPHYHWFFFHDQSIKSLVGDEIVFTEQDGKFIPVRPVLAEKHQDLYNSVQTVIEKHLRSN